MANKLLCDKPAYRIYIKNSGTLKGETNDYLQAQRIARNLSNKTNDTIEIIEQRIWCWKGGAELNG